MKCGIDMVFLDVIRVLRNQSPGPFLLFFSPPVSLYWITRRSQFHLLRDLPVLLLDSQEEKKWNEFDLGVFFSSCFAFFLLLLFLAHKIVCDSPEDKIYFWWKMFSGWKKILSCLIKPSEIRKILNKRRNNKDEKLRW